MLPPPRRRGPPAGTTLTARIELRVTPAVLDEIETWRQSQPEPPSKTEAILHLITLGLGAAATHPEYLPVGSRRTPSQC